MKNSILFYINKIVLLLITLLGFSCDSENDGSVYYEYGAPSADYKAYGTIVDKITLEKLSDIQVAMDGDTIYSNQNGEYEIIAHHLSTFQTYNICCVDTNGVYLPKDTTIDFSDIESENANGWYRGAKTLKVDIRLKTNELPD